MTRLSCGVPVVTSRWKLRNARRLSSVLWIFATYVPRAAWKPSAPLQKRTELVHVASACWPEQVVHASCVRAFTRRSNAINSPARFP